MDNNIVYSNFFKMTKKEEDLFSKLKKETDENEKENLLSQIHAERGIYKNENGNLYVSDMKFVEYILAVFFVICINGSIAFYNFSAHKYEYVMEADYLTFFKTLLDEVDKRLWNSKLEGTIFYYVNIIYSISNLLLD